MTTTPNQSQAPGKVAPSANAPATNSAGKSLLDTAAERGNFKTFTKAVDAAGLGETLRGAGPFTIFAPTDAAFDKLPSGKLDSLMKPENRKELASVLNYHIVGGSRNAAEMGRMSKATTLAGRDAPVKLTGNQLSYDQATVTTQDIGSSNGMLHAIDRVNLPSASSATH